MKLNGFKSRLMAASAVLVAVPLMAVGWFAFDKAGRDVRDMALSGAATSSRHLAELVSLALEDNLRLVGEMAGQQAMARAAELVAEDGVDVPRAEVHGFSREFTEKFKASGKELSQILAIDAQGRIFADSQDGATKGQALKDQAFVKNLQKGPAISQVFADPADGRPLIHLGAPVRSWDKKHLGAVVLTVKVDRLARHLVGARPGQTGYAFMLDGQGRLIAHPQAKLVFKLNVRQEDGMAAIAANMLAGRQGVEEYSFRGDEKVASYAPIKAANWCVVVTQNVDELLATSRALRNGIMIIGLCALALAVLLGLPLLQRIVGPVQRAADRLGQASENLLDTSAQVASSSQILAQNSCEQAASLEQTSSATQQMAALINNTAEHASAADKLMAQAGQAAQKAQAEVAGLLEAMGHIAEAGRQITGVVASIEGLAFQTNMLALNAAVEAARAGDKGNGFAVVADEVRNLARRSSGEAKQTQDLVDGVVARIKDGLARVQSTSRSFAAVDEAVGRASALLGQISGATWEQAQGMDQINQAMTYIDQAVAANSEAAGQSSAHCAHLEDQANSLGQIAIDLSRIVLGSGGNGNGSDPRRLLPAPPEADEAGRGWASH